MALVAVVAFAAAAAGISSRASYGAQTTADEPHYLLTALSLASEDGDLDVRDEFADGPTAVPRARPGPQARPLPDGRLIEPRPPAPGDPRGPGGPRRLGPRQADAGPGRGGAGRAHAVDRRAALGVPVPAAAAVGVFAASAPLAAYGGQVYPELPAALAVAVAIAALSGPLRRGGLVALAAAVVALPWLSVKYAPVAAVLAVVRLWLLVRGGRRRAALALGGGLAAAALVFLGAHQALYGGVTPYAAGSHFVGGELTVVGSDPDYLGRGRRLVGLLVDRDFGLAAWQPAWLLVVPAVAALLARRPRGWAALALPRNRLVATFVALTMQGWWFPGRQVVVVLPAAVLAIAWWARGGGRAAWGSPSPSGRSEFSPTPGSPSRGAGPHRLGGRPPGHGQPALPRLVRGPARLPRRDRRHLGPALDLGGGAGGTRRPRRPRRRFPQARPEDEISRSRAAARGGRRCPRRRPRRG